MISLNLIELTNAANGELFCHDTLTSLSVDNLVTDSRALQKNEAF